MENAASKVADAELEILKILWAHGSPMTDKQIRAALGGESAWRRTTIQTLIKRLLDKEVIIREKREVYYYHPAVSEEEIAKARTVDLLNKMYGGNAKNLISTMLNTDILSKSDIDDLQSYWRGKKEKNE